ncbi:hypothetical protein PTTG_05452 [Puccinia triticina 1-1 BBBD Race 1]|uniref:Uncharacterized protein n=2 Tax=Puccinia triticina TaxID=208348 RepID=A0A0C4EXA4_PUCT1|nr:uncharacterized protein PtA15_6A568 [Puccinia triticina]OAV95401.1 hypothetical protein PTTG_05452 [Puccinia triticina 1-1 BBBD Race 1]WAQ85939.1 hypothetical protein PtA15_6A568 [Puccinia triticina]WAR55834.1 hypothetical protein PtB15_6B577 [Puccinia triticina]
MSSYQTEPRASSRDVSTSGLPPERRRFWVELPGWVTAYVKVELAKEGTKNADVYEVLCDLWKVPRSFGVATEDQVVYVITEALAKRDTSGASGLANVQRQALAQEIVQVIEYLVENSSAKPKRLSWLDPNLSEKLQNVSPSDWIIFPASDMIHWISGRESKDVEKSLRHIPQRPPCRVCVFGNFNQNSLDPNANNGQRKIAAASMELSQIWHKGLFVTFTSKAASSNLDGLRRLQDSLVARMYDALEDPTHYLDIAMWLSMDTYWLLSPPSASEARASRDSTIRSLRAFNQMHDPDLPPIPIISKDHMERGIENIFKDGGTSIHLMKSDILKKLKIPRSDLRALTATRNRIFDRRTDGASELRTIQELGSHLVKTFWMFRLALIVVSEEEMNDIRRSNQLPWCQFVSFENLIALIENNFRS